MIYRSRLQSWFAKQLPVDAEKVDDTFRRLSESDGYMSATIENLAGVLQREADSTLALVDAQKLPEANTQVQQARIACRRSPAWPAPDQRECTPEFDNG